MAYGDIGTVLDELEYDLTDTAAPDMVQVANTIYAIVYTDADGDGILITVEIDAAGNITNTVVDTLEFDTADANDVSICWLLGDIFAIAYRGAGHAGTIVTVEITQAGAIGATVIDSYVFNATVSYENFLFKIADGILAVVCRGASNEGIMTTIGIDAAGNITDPFIDKETGWAANVNNPEVALVSSGIYAIVSRDNAFDGNVMTLGISDAGAVDSGVTDSLEFDTLQGSFPSIVHALGDIFCIAYTSTGSDGTLITVTIDAAGNIGAAPIDTLVFDAARGLECTMLHLGEGIVAIAYSGVDTDGFIVTVQTAVGGAIGPAPIDSLEFDIWHTVRPNLVHVTGDVYAVCYVGNTSDGFLSTMGIATPPAGRGRQLMMMGLC